jgi:hypothetical protein
MKYLKHIIALLAYIFISINVLADFPFHSEPISEVINLVQTFETETSKETILTYIDVYFAHCSGNLKKKLKNLIQEIFGHKTDNSAWFPLFKDKFPEIFTVFDLTEAFEPSAIFTPTIDFQLDFNVYQETYFNKDPIISIQHKSSVYQAWKDRLNLLGKPVYYNLGALGGLVLVESQQVFNDLIQKGVSPLKLDKDAEQKIIDSALNFETPELEVPFEAIKQYIKNYERAFHKKDFKEYLKRRSNLISEFKETEIDLFTQISNGLIRFHHLTEDTQPLTYSKFYKVFAIWSAIVDYSSTPWITETTELQTLPYDIESYKKSLVRGIIDANLHRGFFFMPSLLTTYGRDFIGTLSTPIDSLNILTGNRRFDSSRTHIFGYHFHDFSHTTNAYRAYEGATRNDGQYYIDIQNLYRNRAINEPHFTQALITFLQLCKENLSEEYYRIIHKVLAHAHHEKYVFCLSPIEKDFIYRILGGLSASEKVTLFNSQDIESSLSSLQPLWETAWEDLPLKIKW